MQVSRPWFKFFPSYWLGSRETRFLTAEQRGLLIQLMAEAWQSDPPGSVPANPEVLWRLAGAKSQRRWNDNAEAVLQSFTLSDGRYWNSTLVELSAECDRIVNERRKAGSASAATRQPSKCSTSAEQKPNEEKRSRGEEKRKEEETPAASLSQKKVGAEDDQDRLNYELGKKRLADQDCDQHTRDTWEPFCKHYEETHPEATGAHSL